MQNIISFTSRPGHFWLVGDTVPCKAKPNSVFVQGGINEHKDSIQNTHLGWMDRWMCRWRKNTQIMRTKLKNKTSAQHVPVYTVGAWGNIMVLDGSSPFVWKLLYAVRHAISTGKSVPLCDRVVVVKTQQHTPRSRTSLSQPSTGLT